MKDKIIKICKDIERDFKVKILFVVENGSRNWGMESEDSDYDVRFVFYRPKIEYLKLNRLKEVIDIDKHLPEIDIIGFDIYKICKMLSSSNPNVIEWVHSNIIYYKKIPKEIYNFTHKCKKIALFHHYRSMCKQNYLKYLKSGNLVTYKKYLYAMRGLINAKYVKKYGQIPPIIFKDTITDLSSIIPEEISKKLFEIIRLKKKGKEKDIIQNIVRMDSYIENFLKTEEWTKGKEDIVDSRELENYILGLLE